MNSVGMKFLLLARKRDTTNTRLEFTNSHWNIISGIKMMRLKLILKLMLKIFPPLVLKPPENFGPDQQKFEILEPILTDRSPDLVVLGSLPYVLPC